MKLRNKKTGEITEYVTNFYIETTPYNSLAELNEEWEDYKPTEKKPRRYRLIKDLPTFDKGDEFYIAQTGALWYDGGGDDDVFAYATSTLMEFPNILEEWFEPIEPKEPLIEDDEIREIIRAWAKANDATKLKYNYDENSLDDIYRNSITFNYGLGLRDGHTYTIPELCGEEEE